MSCGGEGIHEKKLYIIFRSVEMVSLLCVLSIMNISLCLSLLCLDRNYGNLGNYFFEVVYMSKAVDLIDKAIAEITKDRNLMLYNDFIMNIFEPLAKKIKPFKKYLNYMFERQKRCPDGSQEEEDKVYLYDLLRSELYLPRRKKNI